MKYCIEELVPFKVAQESREWIVETRTKLLLNMTWDECICGTKLTNYGIKFFPQTAVLFDGRIGFVDFYCPEEKIIIEIDGPYHYTSKQMWYDRRRDEFLQNELKIRVHRIPNGCVTKENLCSIFGRALKVVKPSSVEGFTPYMTAAYRAWFSKLPPEKQREEIFHVRKYGF